jgi:hypothetical protein
MLQRCNVLFFSERRQMRHFLKNCLRKIAKLLHASLRLQSRRLRGLSREVRAAPPTEMTSTVTASVTAVDGDVTHHDG